MDDPHENSEPLGAEALALEYLQQRAEGAAAELEPWLVRLPAEDEQRRFRGLIEEALRIERALPRAPRALGPNQLIAGRYVLLRQIGAGGMGQVWEAHDRELERRVAVKFLDGASQGRSDREELFQKESRLLASLQHPGIVAVHEFGREADLTYIVMDLVHGRSLADVLDDVRGQFLARGEQPLPCDASLLSEAIRQPLPQGRLDLCAGGDWFRAVARIELELVRTLEAAHGQHVVHRDLKPSNVMLTAGGNPVVLDFGLAGSSEGTHGAVTQGLYGSVAYLAPEQAKSQKVGSDPRTDVYQLGLVLYELLTLQRTFPGTAIGDVLERIQNGRFPAPRKVHKLVPRELQAICLCAIELDPGRRYASARELREDLERWLDGHELPRAMRAGRTRRALRRVRWHVRQRPWLSAAAGLVLAGGAGIAWWYANPREPWMLTLEQPLRFDHERGEVVYLEPDDRTVKTDDYLGFHLRSNKPLHVWALSVFGPAGSPDRVSPWRAVPASDPRARAGEFGLQLPAGENDVLGTRILAHPNPSEGLVLLVADGPRPGLESWFELLDRGQGENGMPWEQARELGAQVLLPAKGGSREESARTEEDLRRLRLAFAKAGGPAAAKWIEFEDVRTLQVQCQSR